MKPKAPCCFLLAGHWRRDQDTEHHRPQTPMPHSFNKIVSMTICFILFLSASTHCPAAGSFLEDSVNNGSVGQRKRFRDRKPGESSVLYFLALRSLARYPQASVFSGINNVLRYKTST